MGVPQVATADLHVVLAATTDDGVVRVERTGALTLVPTDGTWRIAGYDLDRRPATARGSPTPRRGHDRAGRRHDDDDRGGGMTASTPRRTAPPSAPRPGRRRAARRLVAAAHRPWPLVGGGGGIVLGVVLGQVVPAQAQEPAFTLTATRPTPTSRARPTSPCSSS